MPARARIVLPAGGVNVGPSQPLTISSGKVSGQSFEDEIPCKEWCVTDDVLNLSDSASVSIANEDGRHTGKFTVGQRIELDLADEHVAGGQWVRTFTGILTSIESYSDIGGGSCILLGAMDLGWHLTQSHARPLIQIKNKRFRQLLEAIIDPSWGIGEIVAANDTNKRLKHGRQVVVINHQPTLGAVLPFIQIEPGQAPMDVLQTYAAREGVLVNMGARGELIFFRPHYDEQALYTIEYHPSSSKDRRFNNIVGRPRVREVIDGKYSEVQCWSTVVIPPEVQNSENPNEAFRHTTFRPSENPLPFERRLVFSDPEAINPKLRKNRATWRQQMGLFQSWSYEVEFPEHSQDGAFFVADTLATIFDEVHAVRGTHYVQSVRRSYTLKDGARSALMIRKTGLLNPELQTLDLGGGAKRGAQQPKAVK